MHKGVSGSRCKAPTTTAPSPDLHRWRPPLRASMTEREGMAQRRLAVILSHLPRGDPEAPEITAAPCSSAAGGGGCGGGDGYGGERDCVFCRIIRGESPAFKLYEDDVCLCILDSNPVTFGHSLVVPKSHFPSFDATPPGVVAAMFSKVPFLSNCIMKAAQCDSFNLLVNNGASAGQVIFHTHLHIIPRKNGDKLWSSQSSRRHPIEPSKKTTDLVNAVREIVSSRFDGDRDDSSILEKHVQGKKTEEGGGRERREEQIKEKLQGHMRGGRCRGRPGQS